MPQVRLVLVGAAGLVAAPAHLNALRKLDQFELFGVCDSNVQSLAARAEQYSVPHIYSNLQQVLEDDRVDAIDLVVPPAQHAPMTLAAAKAGKHVYVEKPMAHTVGQAREMIAAAETAQVTLMVGESYWFHAPHTRAAELIAAGEIGDVLQVRQTKGPWLFTAEEDARLGGEGHYVSWRFDPEASGGGAYPWMMDHGCHLFAAARRLCNGKRIGTVSTIGRSQGFGREEHLRGITSLTWTYADDSADGVWTQTEHGPEAVPYIGFRTEVIGTTGSMLVFGEGGGAAPGYMEISPITVLSDGDMFPHEIDEPPDRAWQSNNCYYDHAHRHTLAEFADAILAGRSPSYTPADGLHDLAATLATIRSASEGRAVHVDEMDDDWRPS